MPMATPTILLVDTDNERTSALKLIVEYLEYQAIVVTDCDRWREQFEDADGIDVVLLGPTDTEPALQKVFRELKEQDEHIPIVAMIRPGTEDRLNQDIENGTVSKVALPVKHTELQNALQRARML